MKRIIVYDELPKSEGQSIYLRMETDPRLYLSLLSKGYRIVNNIFEADSSTIYVTGRRQATNVTSTDDYRKKFEAHLQELLAKNNITKPKTMKFSYQALKDHLYTIPFVLKNENQNGGREKFLIATEEDYENLIKACDDLIRYKIQQNSPYGEEDIRNRIDYEKYLDVNFTVQEYIQTPSEYCTSMRVLTSSSNDLMVALLKYKKPVDIKDETTLLGYLLREVYPLSTKTIVSNTLSGGKNIVIGNDNYSDQERNILDSHHIPSDKFDEVIQASQDVHEECKRELGIICGFDYIYDQERKKWLLLEYHSRPMVGEYAKRQGLSYDTVEDKLTAEGRVRATALSLVLKKQ